MRISSFSLYVIIQLKQNSLISNETKIRGTDFSFFLLFGEQKRILAILMRTFAQFAILVRYGFWFDWGIITKHFSLLIRISAGRMINVRWHPGKSRSGSR